MGDVVGRLFHEFAITLAATIVISAVVSLTLVPMMCAKLLRPTPPGRAAAITRPAAASSRGCCAFTARSLNVVLNHQVATLLVALATFFLTGYLYVAIPKGFFPVQDTGIIQGVTQAAQDISFDKMAEHQQAFAKAISADRDVESLSSFIGVDGSNVTLNSGRFLINLKPHAERQSSASEVIRRLQQETADVAGISLYMQPVQDLSIDTAVSATQYQFTLENQDLATLQTWTPKVLARLAKVPDIVDVASDLQPNGRSVIVNIDRASAARFGITPATIDNALYDAYGQRIISTVFTQSNQYRVILDIDPGDDAFAGVARTRSTCPRRPRPRGQVPLSAISSLEVQAVAVADFASQAVSGDDDFVQPARPAPRSAARSTRSTPRSPTSICPPASRVSFQGAAQAFQSSLSNEVFLLLAAVADDVYRARRSLRELHPPDHDSLDAAVGRHRRAAGARDRRRRPRHHRRHRHRAADRHRQEERDHDDRLRPRGAARRRAERRATRSIRPACSACGRS